MTKIKKNHKSMSEHRKECCNKVEELEVESFVVTKKTISRQKMKMREQKTITTVYFMLQHFKLMSQYRARLKDKKFCHNKEIYVAIEFRSSKK